MHRQLIYVYNKYDVSAIHLNEISMANVSRYGIATGNRINSNAYKITELAEKPQNENIPPNLAIMGRYVLTQDIFNRLDETERNIGEEFHLTDSLQKLDKLYVMTYDSEIYNVRDKLEWTKTSIDFTLDDEFRDELIEYMISHV